MHQKKKFFFEGRLFLLFLVLFFLSYTFPILFFLIFHYFMVFIYNFYHFLIINNVFFCKKLIYEQKRGREPSKQIFSANFISLSWLTTNTFFVTLSRLFLNFFFTNFYPPNNVEYFSSFFIIIYPGISHVLNSEFDIVFHNILQKRKKIKSFFRALLLFFFFSSFLYKTSTVFRPFIDHFF